MLLFWIWIVTVTVRSQVVIDITNPAEQRVVCASGSICHITCNQSSICRAKEFRFEVNSNVTLHCTGRASCHSAVIISDAIHFEMYVTNPTDYAYGFLSGYAFINVYANGYYKTVFQNSQNAYIYYESALYKEQYPLNSSDTVIETYLNTLEMNDTDPSYGIVEHHCIGSYACFGQFIYAQSIYQLNLHCDTLVSGSCQAMEVFAPYNNIEYDAVNVYGIEGGDSLYAVKGLRQINMVDSTSSNSKVICYYDYSQSCVFSSCASDTNCGLSSTYQYPPHNVSTLYAYYDYHQLIYTKHEYDIIIHIVDRSANDDVLFVILPNFVTEDSTSTYWPMALNRQFNLYHKRVTVHPTHHKTVDHITLNATLSDELYIERTNDGNDRFVQLTVYGPGEVFYFTGESWFNPIVSGGINPSNVYYLQNTKQITFFCPNDIAWNCFSFGDEIHVGAQLNVNINCGTHDNACDRVTVFSEHWNATAVWEDPQWNIQCTEASCSQFRFEFECGYCYINGTTNQCKPYIKCTSDPTMDPTVDPTPHPTMDPTMDPTIDPTLNPTMFTVHPTRYPTLYPSKYPTLNPSMPPTSYGVTWNPTRDPTSSPSNDPTQNPTMPPTRYPTIEPTVHSVSIHPTVSAEVTSNPTDATVIIANNTMESVDNDNGSSNACFAFLILITLMSFFFFK
eukprot:122473_1